jgi:putative cardiolipin synthase
MGALITPIVRAPSKLPASMPSDDTEAKSRRFGLAARNVLRSLPAVALLALLPGCATVGSNVPPEPSFAIQRPETTRLGMAFAQNQERHPGQSGFVILDYGLEALLARVETAGSADMTIDAQYYIYNNDAAGSLLTERLLAAADRGVRVRLLLDDFNLGNERELVALCAHPRIQVRIFNPISRGLRWAHLLEYAIHFNRADRRMHNKLFIVDNEIAILGGRNIGDDYFNVNASNLFRDFDVLAAGPITLHASAVFDRYWNSSWAVPAPALMGQRPSPSDLDWLRRRIDARVKQAAKSDKEYPATTNGDYLSSLEHKEGALTWADGEIISDPPDEIAGVSSDRTLVARRLDEEWAKAGKEALIEAAYFAPGSEDISVFDKLKKRGVAVRILTSAADATDVPIVYCAYRGYRKSLLEAGVNLYEFRMRAGPSRPDHKWNRLRPTYSTLHSKVIVFDRQTAWIGSFNLDPRSAHLNTEIAVLVHSEQFSEKLARSIIDDFSPDRSWQVRLDTEGFIVWMGDVDGRPVVLQQEPTSIGRRLTIFLLSLVPGARGEI